VKRDYATTFAAEAVVITGYLLTFRIVALHLGTAGFAEYALSRRALAVLAPVGLIGVDMAMARFLALNQGNRSRENGAYPAAALLVMVSAVTLLSGLLVAFRDPMSQLFFGSRAYSQLILPLPLLLLGSGLHGVAYGYLRGLVKIPPANVLVALNQGLVPLLAALAVGGSVMTLLVVVGIAWCIVSTAFLVRTPMVTSQIRLRVRELVGYGGRRIPGDLLQLGLFALPGILVAQSGNISEAGAVAFGVAAIGMVGSALTPIQFVLLPVAARYLSSGSIRELRRHVGSLVRLTIIILSAGTVVAELSANVVIRAYLGAGFDSATGVLRLIMLGALPWGIVVTLRSVIDARHYRAVNARNMGAAFASFVLVAVALHVLVGPAQWTIVVAFVVGLYTVGVLTVLEVVRITRQDPDAASPAMFGAQGVALPAGPGDVLGSEAQSSS
jgi:O-antigen/teichoic acid export membrane protein